MAKVLLEKQKAHQVYKKDGERVPGATTVLNLYDGGKSRLLIGWAVREVQAGNDPTKVTQAACDIGTVAHFLVECNLNGDEPDLHEFAPYEIERAEKAYRAYKEWEDQFKSFEVVKTEIQLVSKAYWYGGTLDLVARINDKLHYIDFKTSKGVYPTHKMQASSYCQLWDEHYPGDPIEKIIILKISKEDAEFTPTVVTDKEKEIGWKMFLSCHDLYWWKKEVGW